MPVTIRSTVAALKNLVDVDEDKWPDDKLYGFQEAAAWLVQDVVVPAYDPAATDAKLEIIERYLTAHFYSVSDPVSISDWIGSVRTFYEYKVDLHLNLTRFGQQAMLMDTSGALAAFNNRLKNADKYLPAENVAVSGFWLGTEPESN